MEEELNYKSLFRMLGYSLWKITALTLIHIRDFLVLMAKFFVGLVRNYPQVALVTFLVLVCYLSLTIFVNKRYADKQLEHTKFTYEEKLKYEHHINEINIESITNLRQNIHALEVELDAVKNKPVTKVKITKIDTANVIQTN